MGPRLSDPFGQAVLVHKIKRFCTLTWTERDRDPFQALHKIHTDFSQLCQTHGHVNERQGDAACSYPPHPAVGEQIRDSPGGIVLLGHAQHLADPPQRRIVRRLREEAPGLGQHPDPTASSQPCREAHHGQRRRVPWHHGSVLARGPLPARRQKALGPGALRG